MKDRTRAIKVSVFALVLISAILVAVEIPVVWNGGNTKNWSDVLSWEGTTVPRDGFAKLSAADVCDPNAFHECGNEPDVCLDGPLEGESCSTHSDCDCVAQFTSIYNFNGVTPADDFFRIDVIADSSNSMTLQKGTRDPGSVGDKTINISSVFKLIGDSTTKRAILDQDNANISTDKLETTSFVDIDLDADTILTVSTEFLVQNTSTADAEVDLTGTGLLDVSGGKTKILNVSTSGTQTTTLKVNMASAGAVSDYKVGDLEIIGSNSSTRKAVFNWISGDVLTGTKQADSLLMRGHSLLDVDDTVDRDFVVNGNLTVNTTTATVATIDMLAVGDEFKANNFTIQGGDASGESAELVLKKGKFVCNGTITIAGDVADAKLVIPADTNVNPVFTHITLESRGILKVDDNDTLSGKLTIVESSVENSELDIANNKELTVDQLVVDATSGAVDYTPEFNSSGKVVTAP